MKKKTVIKCFLCGRWLVVHRTKKNTPYFFCPDCKMRVFVNSESGIRNLKKKIKLKEVSE